MLGIFWREVSVSPTLIKAKHCGNGHPHYYSQGLKGLFRISKLVQYVYT